MEFDLVAMGGGFSGLTTAARAAQLGLKVAVFEQLPDERYLCNSRYSSGVANVLGHFIGSPEDQLKTILERATAGTAKSELIEAYSHHAGRVYEWLRSEGLRFVMMFPTSKDRRSAVLAPPRRFKSGLDWDGRGADVSMRRLEQNIIARGGQVMRGAKVTGLIVEEGVCRGVEATIAGVPQRCIASTVVIADGGFMANPDMIGQHITAHPNKVNIRSAPNVKGDGMLMAEKAGAELSGFGNFYGHLQHRDAMHNANLWPYPTFDAIAQAGLLVTDKGLRFTDEGRGGVPMTNDVAKLDDPLSAFVIYDQAMWEGAPGLAGPVAINPSLSEGDGWAYSADALDALAEKAGIESEALLDTVAHYNRAVASDTLETLNPPRTTRVFKAWPIERRPFHAVPLCAGITGTMGGLSIDPNARVLRQDGSAIDGLYAVGTTTGGLEGGPNIAYAGGLSKAFIWGVLAAEHAAQYVGARRAA